MKRGVDAMVGTGVRTAMGAAFLAFGASQAGAQTLEILHSFDVNASGPFSRVIQGSDGSFYGATSNGGEYGEGILFKVNGDGTGFRILHAFNVTDGKLPYAGPVEGS